MCQPVITLCRSERRRLAREGSDVSIITYGAQVREAEAAADRLVEVGVSVEILDLRLLKPLGH